MRYGKTEKEVAKINAETGFTERTLVHMMFDGSSIDSFRTLWNQDKDAEKWGYLLHMCYCEDSYERVGGDYGDSENFPIHEKRLHYLGELIFFLEELGIEETGL